MIPWWGKPAPDDLEYIKIQLNKVIKTGEMIMYSVDDLTDVVTQVAEQVNRIGPAVDQLEAKLTAALKNVGIPVDVQAKIDAAVGSLRGVVANVATAVNDAADNVDEAEVVATEPTPPVV